MPYPPKDSIHWRDEFASLAGRHLHNAENELRWAIRNIETATLVRELTARQKASISKRLSVIYDKVRQIDTHLA